MFIICLFVSFPLDRLFFVTLAEECDSPAQVVSALSPPRGTRSTGYICVDDDYAYNNFYKDFGPHSLGTLYRYCLRMERLLVSQVMKMTA
jgi:hypothetical protein